MMRCIIVDDEEFSRLVVRGFVERFGKIEIVAECDNAKEAFGVLKKEPVDVVFLDIEMPEMTGIDLVKSLDQLPQVILITGRNDFASEAFEYGLTDYLKKPIDYNRFEQALKKAELNMNREVLETKSQEDIYVKSDGKIARIKVQEIIYVEALSDYVKINTLEKQFVVHATMKGIQQKLGGQFVRVHRSYIVNIEQVETIEESMVILPKKEIPIGASYKSEFLSKLNFL